MHTVFLSIGGNLGNKRMNFEKVHKIIQQKIGNIIKLSSIYETEPWGFESKRMFWNQVVEVKTNLNPNELLKEIGLTEKECGRKRGAEKFSSRMIDIDILYFDDLILNTESLEIPHPRMHIRNFVLVPLTEIAPAFLHPVLKKTSLQMLEHCPDSLKVKSVFY